MAAGRKRRKSKDDASIEVTSTRSGGVDIDAESVNIGGDIVGRDKISNIVNTVNNLFLGGITEARERRNQLILLDKVNSFWIRGVLDNSVHGAAQIELGLQERPEAVEHPWEILLRTANRHGRTLSSGQKIIDTFDEMEHSLLILGEPGSGKTTLLLELARDLITRAKENHVQPIPVVFSLSSWAEKKQNILDWLVEELNTKYQIPRQMGRRWVENDDLALLLDGLDEVQEQHRSACVEAINQFRQEHGLAAIAVCSRSQEYEELTRRLKLGGAIVIQPLTREQVNRYVAAGGTRLAALQYSLQQDALLQEIAQSPLMLSIMSLTYHDMPLDALAAPRTGLPEDRRRQIFDTYIRRMFQRHSRDAAYPSTRTVDWLTWLAQQMSRHSQSVFLMEQMQPDWLPTRLQRIVYVFSTRLVAALVVGLGMSLVLYFSTPSQALLTPLMWSLAAGLSAGLVDSLRFERGHPAALRGHPRFWRSAASALGVGFLVGLISGAAVKLAAGSELGLGIGLVVGFPFGTVLGLRGVRRGVYSDIQPVDALSWSGKSFIRGAVIGACVGLTILFSGNLLYGEDIGTFPQGPLVFGAGGGIFGSLLGGLRGTAIPGKTYPNQGIRLSARNAAIGGLVSGLGVGLVMSLIGATPVPNAIGGGVLYGSLFGLWYGGLDLMQHFTLRFMLYLTQRVPWRYTRFLDYAAERIFLRKVGGGYIFVHRLLQEYFALLQPKLSTRIA